MQQDIIALIMKLKIGAELHNI